MFRIIWFSEFRFEFLFFDFAFGVFFIVFVVVRRVFDWRLVRIRK